MTEWGRRHLHRSANLIFHPVQAPSAVFQHGIAMAEVQWRHTPGSLTEGRPGLLSSAPTEPGGGVAL